MSTFLTPLADWSTVIGLGAGLICLLIAVAKQTPGLGLIALIICGLAGLLGGIPALIVALFSLWMVIAQPIWVRAMASNFSIAGELIGFLWERKLWWMIPMVVTLLAFGLLLIFASASGIGPFIYTLF